jgi:propanol-preferring alcohol dehydrogenase
MKAWLLEGVYDMRKDREPLRWADISVRKPEAGEVLIRVTCCGVCHTELDEIEGRTPPSHYPMVPGHQVVGSVEEVGSDVQKLRTGDRVGVAWIYSSCGSCSFCRSGKENLCPDFRATGRDAHGGYAQYMIARERFVYVLPEHLKDEEAAPLLCAGAVGYRSFKLSGIASGQVLGLSGFGASNHLILKWIKALYPDIEVFVFARSTVERNIALDLGANWAGDFNQVPPEQPHAVIDTTPVWKTILWSLRHLRPGGKLVINNIRKENIDQHELLQLDYAVHLWMEKQVVSVANVTPADVVEFLNVAAQAQIKPSVNLYSFAEANRALWELKNQPVTGAKILIMDN